MKWLLLTIMLIALFVLTLLITKLKVYVDYYHAKDNDHLKILMKAWGGILRYKVEIPVIKIDDDSPTLIAEEKVEAGPKGSKKKQKTDQLDKTDLLNSIKDFKTLLAHVVGFHKIVRNFLKKVSLSQLEWHTVIGVGDAAATGTVTGAFWAVKGGIVGILSRYMKMKDMPVMTVTPNFQQAISQTRFKCMIQVRVGHAILAGIKMVKYWKGGMPEFKRKPLSALSGDKTKSV
ncbi:DUF2953 domain-containing protein [Bacillus sp. REN3]|uniref:DUF2953 domain-containing protein n=1 Tax=Bacillus sp. REN3 TaxID=2802440 RepID=UPI001AEF0A93|nr:DUF2953 domain-containing protein [Bacillus sp. REN3]